MFSPSTDRSSKPLLASVLCVRSVVVPKYFSLVICGSKCVSFQDRAAFRDSMVKRCIARFHGTRMHCEDDIFCLQRFCFVLFGILRNDFVITVQVG